MCIEMWSCKGKKSKNGGLFLSNYAVELAVVMSFNFFSLFFFARIRTWMAVKRNETDECKMVKETKNSKKKKKKRSKYKAHSIALKKERNMTLTGLLHPAILPYSSTHIQGKKKKKGSWNRSPLCLITIIAGLFCFLSPWFLSHAFNSIQVKKDSTTAHRSQAPKPNLHVVIAMNRTPFPSWSVHNS